MIPPQHSTLAPPPVKNARGDSLSVPTAPWYDPRAVYLVRHSRDGSNYAFKRNNRKRWCSKIMLSVFLLVVLLVMLDEIGHVSIAFSHFLHAISVSHASAGFRINTASSCAAPATWTIDTHSERHLRGHPYEATASFDFPVDSDLLYFISRGTPSFIQGSIEIMDTGVVDSTNVTVDIIASYDTPSDFELTQTCWLQPRVSHMNKAENGLGISGPKSWERPDGSHYLAFDIKIRLPRRSDGILNILDLQTDLPMFNHHIGNLQDTVYFEKLGLRADGRPITVEAFVGGVGHFSSGRSSMEGSFIVDSSLTFRGLDTAIKANVSLLNADARQPSRLLMHTDRREIEANVTLASTHNGFGGAFDVKAITTLGALQLAFLAAPPDAVLNVEGSTMRAPVRVALHETFEGAVHATSCVGAVPPALGDPDVPDPAGLGRHRSLELRRTQRNGIDGTVAWVPSRMEGPRGSVKLSTLGAGCALVL